MHVVGADGRDANLSLCANMKPGKKVVTSFDVRDTCESEFFDEPILKRAVHAFDAALAWLIA